VEVLGKCRYRCQCRCRCRCRCQCQCQWQVPVPVSVSVTGSVASASGKCQWPVASTSDKWGERASCVTTLAVVSVGHYTDYSTR
jgi:hypothetical protein